MRISGKKNLFEGKKEKIAENAVTELTLQDLLADALTT